MLEITSHLKVDLRGETQKMVLDNTRPGNDSRYFDRNVAADNEVVGGFFGGKTACYEIRCDHKFYVEAIYNTEGVQDDRAFDKVGLNPVRVKNTPLR